MKLGLGIGVVLLLSVAGGVIGFGAGKWWLDRTLEHPDGLDEVAYRAGGTIIGALLALILALALTWIVGRTRRDR